MLNIPNIDKKEIDNKVRKGMPFQHKWHNNFHLEMPFGLINDPNGLTYLDGEYHVFFQWNPLGCEHKNKCWGHVKTADFVNYTMPELSMMPTDYYDKNGCYSGSGFAEDGKVRLLYTNNAKDEQGNRIATQRISTLQSDGTASKDEIIVNGPAEGFTAHYRDPYYFEKNGNQYIIIGVQRENETGTVTVYQRTQKGQAGVANEKWDYLGELKTNEELKNFGYMWECPGVVNTVDAADNKEKTVLLFCPQGLEAEEYRYQNIFQSGYVVGDMDLESMTMKHGEFIELDYGFDFYAPQVLKKDDRHILFGWMGMPDKDSEYPSANEGWMYSLTMPRELTLKDNHVYSMPVKEIEALRTGNNTEFNEKNTSEYTVDLPEASEVAFEAETGNVEKIDVEFAYNEEKLVYSYDCKKQVMTIDRDGMKLGGRGVRRFKLENDGKLKIRFFVDKCAVEAFFQDGYAAASTLIFKQDNVAPTLKVNADVPLDSVSVKTFEMGSHLFI